MKSKLYVHISIFEIQATQLNYRMESRRSNCNTAFGFYFRKMVLDIFLNLGSYSLHIFLLFKKEQVFLCLPESCKVMQYAMLL